MLKWSEADSLVWQALTPMRILQLVHQYAPEHTGGTELYTQWLSRKLSERGHEVSVFYRRDAEGEGLDSRLDQNITVWAAWSGTVRPVTRFLASFSDQAIHQSFLRVLMESRPDLVHVQHAMSLPLSIFRELRKRQIPYLVTLHDFWWVCANSQLLTNYSQEICNGPQAYLNCARCALARLGKPGYLPAVPAIALPMAWRNRALRFAMDGAERLITPSVFVKDWYAAHGATKNKVTVARPGLERFESPPKSDRKSNVPFRAGYLGGISWQKGVHTLVKAFVQLEGDIELWIAGDLQKEPDYVTYLHQLADSRVKFLGELERNAVWQMLSKIDVIAVPSLWYEAHCFVISEAFAAGVPVIASDLGVMAERVGDGVNGILVPPGNVSALREALDRTRRDRGLVDQLRAGIPPQRTLEEHMRDIETIYREVIELTRNLHQV